MGGGSHGLEVAQNKRSEVAHNKGWRRGCGRAALKLHTTRGGGLGVAHDKRGEEEEESSNATEVARDKCGEERDGCTQPQ